MTTERPIEPSHKETAKPVSPELILELNFVPKWARAPSVTNPYENLSPKTDHGNRGRSPRDGKRSGGRRNREDRNNRGTGQQRREGVSSGGGDRRGSSRGQKPGALGQHRSQDQKGPPRDASRQSNPPLAVDIRFLPDRVQLGAVVREMHRTFKAYPMMDLASLFIQRPDHCLVKLQGRRPDSTSPPITFYQCKQCMAVFLDETGCTQHITTNHLEEFYVVETIDGPPPAGNFVCVGRCRRTGKLLGPPNHHAFNRILQEMVTTHFPGMSLQKYREQVETVRDPELIEQWKNESRIRKVYRAKTEQLPTPVQETLPDPSESPGNDADVPGGGDRSLEDGDAKGDVDSGPPAEEKSISGPPKEKASEDNTAEQMDFERVKRHFQENLLPDLIRRSHQVTLPASVAQSMEEGPIKQLLRNAWNKESRYPLSMTLAMRPAFRHMRLHLFKTSRKDFFVTAIQPRPLDQKSVIDSIRKELEYLREHPGCTRQEMVESLCPAAPLDSPEVAEVVGNLRWFVEKGHVIEFYNGRLSVPSANSAPDQTAPKAHKRSDRKD